MLAVDELKRRLLVGRREGEEAVSGMQVVGWTWWVGTVRGICLWVFGRARGQVGLTNRAHQRKHNDEWVERSSHASHEV